MARKKSTTPVHDDLHDYTERITKLAMARGVIMEQKRINEWIINHLETTKSPVELNLLRALAEVVNNG